MKCESNTDFIWASQLKFRWPEPDSDEHEALLVGADALQDGAVLRGHHREHLDGDAVELVEAAPRARLRKPREEVARHLVVHLVGAVGDDDPDREAAPQVLGRLGLAGAGGASRSGSSSPTAP